MFKKRFSVLIFMIITAMVLLTSGCGQNLPDNIVNASEEEFPATSSPVAQEKTVKAFDLTFFDVSEVIHVNQTGYYPDELKRFYLSSQKTNFYIVNVSNSNVVYSSETTETKKDDICGEDVCIGDFSSLSEEGTYCIVIPELGKSYSFDINKEAYKKLSQTVLKMFYYHRSDINLLEEYAGIWSRKAVNYKNAVLFGNTNIKKNVSGRWYNGSGYGKYTIPATKAVQDLMLAYEMFPSLFGDDLNIPESGNGIPDILDEVKYELQWLRKMQDSQNGGVYHKATFNNPSTIDTTIESTKDNEIYLLPISSTATADFAAVMAKAYLLYKDIDSNFANECLVASKKAWSWLEQNEFTPLFKNPPEITTLEYSDFSDLDERLWASVELYKATLEEGYHDYIMEKTSIIMQDVYTYKANIDINNVALYGLIDYLLMDSEKTDKMLRSSIQAYVVNGANQIMRTAISNSFNVGLQEDQYKYGSNMMVMNSAMYLIIANKIKPNQEYINVAYQQFNYILGANPINKSYISGIGTNTVQNPFHSISHSDSIKDPIPGMLVGGPNMDLTDETSKQTLSGVYPQKCYFDNFLSDSTNSVSIAWNSSMVFVSFFFTK